MSTLVVCVDRNGDIAGKTGVGMPVVGWEAIQSLVVDIGVADPEDSSVNCLLEGLRVARDLRDGDESATVAVVSGTADSIVGADRAIASQLDSLVAGHDPDSAIVVVDSESDERVIPMVESRIRVDSVDRVVVRQARDIESTYYLLKQFLADEELRGTVLVPVGIVLVVFPILLLLTDSPALAAATIAAVIGVFVLYKGLGVGDYLSTLPAQVRDALYSGRVSIVTYVVAAGLSLVGGVAGVLGVSELGPDPTSLLTTMAFVYDAVPWLALAALVASTGRLLDEAIQNDRVRAPYLNLPFGVVALGVVLRGFSAYFLERAGTLAALETPTVDAGPLTVRPVTLVPAERLALFVVCGVVISLVGIRVSASLMDTGFDADEEGEDDGRSRGA